MLESPNGDGGDGYWSLAQTLAGREAFAAQNLQRQGYEVLNLRCRQRVGHKSRVVALFPGYVLLKICGHFWSARRAVGVIDLLMNFEKPARLPQSEFERITSAYDPKTGLVKLPKRQSQDTAMPGFARGDNVKILTGPLTGFAAIFDGMAARDRVLVLLNMFGRRSRVMLAPDDKIAAISPV